VKDAVYDVTKQFIGPKHAETCGLADGLRDADEDLAVEIQMGGIGGVIKGEDIGDSGVAQMGGVEPGDFGVADQVNAEGEASELEVLGEKGGEQRPQGGEGDSPCGSAFEERQPLGGEGWRAR